MYFSWICFCQPIFFIQMVDYMLHTSFSFHVGLCYLCHSIRLNVLWHLVAHQQSCTLCTHYTKCTLGEVYSTDCTVFQVLTVPSYSPTGLGDHCTLPMTALLSSLYYTVHFTVQFSVLQNPLYNYHFFNRLCPLLESHLAWYWQNDSSLSHSVGLQLKTPNY